MKKTTSILAVILIIAATQIGFSACSQNCKKDGKCKKEMCCKKQTAACKKDTTAYKKEGSCCKKKTAQYSCPMCKDITSDKPGKCSKCGMDLEKK